MRIQRFFGNFDFSLKTIAVEKGDFYNQIKNVLRLKPGDDIILCDGKENEAECKISSIEDKKISLEIYRILKNKNEPQIKVTAHCSILKRENFELVVQKLTELGVFKIIPIISKNTVKQGIKKERLETIIREAAEQSGRGIIPELGDPAGFKEALESAQKNGPIVFFDSSGEESLRFPDGQTISVFIGPEGGWDKSELDLSKEIGVKIFSLGKLTLRAETAAIAGTFAVLNTKN